MNLPNQQSILRGKTLKIFSIFTINLLHPFTQIESNISPSTPKYRCHSKARVSSTHTDYVEISKGAQIIKEFTLTLAKKFK